MLQLGLGRLQGAAPAGWKQSFRLSSWHLCSGVFLPPLQKGTHILEVHLCAISPPRDQKGPHLPTCLAHCSCPACWPGVLSKGESQGLMLPKVEDNSGCSSASSEENRFLGTLGHLRRGQGPPGKKVADSTNDNDLPLVPGKIMT